MTSPERNSADKEPPAPVDDASFMAALQAAADLLESRKVPPDVDGFDIKRMPFGPSKSGTLGAYAILLLDSELLGNFRYTPSYSNAITLEESSIGVIREEHKSLWCVRNSSGTMDNGDIARLLWAKWPLDAAGDAEAKALTAAYEQLLGDLSSATSEESDRATYRWLREWLVPMAPNHLKQTVRSYRHHTIEITPDDTLIDGTTELTVREYFDSPRRIGLTATQPDDESDGKIRFHTAVTESDGKRLATVGTYIGHENGGTDPVDPRDKPKILGSLLPRLENLMDEKCPR